MKKFLLLIFTLVLLLPISASAKEKVNLYLFHSETCSHCQAELEKIKELEKKYDNLKVHLYEVSNKDNKENMKKVKEKLEIESNAVPFTIIGNYYYIGYNEEIAESFEEKIQKFSEEKEVNVVKPILENKELPKVEMINGYEEYQSKTKKVDLYLFHSATCMHCQAEIEFLDELKKEYPNLNVHLYEVDRNKENQTKMIEVKEKLGIDSPNVPFTIIGNYYYIGFTDGIEDGIRELVEKFTNEESVNVVKPILEGKEVPNIEILNGEIKTINVFGHDINPAKLSLPVLSVVLGAIDGFNPCAMWVLIFLISMMFNMKNKKKMWCLGLIFLITSAAVYLLFMFVWLGITTTLLTKVFWFKFLIAAVALVGAFVNLKSFYNSLKKGSGCEVVNENKRKKIFDKIKKITNEKNFILAILGVMILAVSVNVIELACSAGIPVLFTNVLALNELSNFEVSLYVAIYIFFFLIDDIIVFVIAMLTLNIKAISTRYTKYSHLIGGIIMLIIGLLMLFKPEWLMFNFK